MWRGRDVKEFRDRPPPPIRRNRHLRPRTVPIGVVALTEYFTALVAERLLPEDGRMAPSRLRAYDPPAAAPSGNISSMPRCSTVPAFTSA